MGENCIFTGDTLFRLGAGRTDLPTGNYQHLLGSLKRLSHLSGDYKIYPGHGKASTLDVERTMNPFMIEAEKA
jgi:glyoxylase-like metal-dependent hydrolase (beta-lactamase superfamily II)